MLHELGTFGEQGGERVGVAGSDRRVEASSVQRGGVLPDAARRATHSWPLGRQLLEAGERLDVARGVEVLEVGHTAVATEDEERDELELERTTASTVVTAER